MMSPRLSPGTLIGLAAAVLSVPALGAPAVTTAAASPATGQLDRAQVEGLIRSYLLEHPEIIPEAMQRLKERQRVEEERTRNEAISTMRAQLETPFEGAWIGNPNADVVVVEFFDYGCGYCRSMAPDVERLVTEDPKIKVVFREFPILGPGSVEAARTGLQAARLGTYAKYHHSLFAAGAFSKATLRAAANKSKVKLPKDLSVLDAELTANHRMARELGITGTPAFIIGGRFANGAVGYDSLKELVAAVRAADVAQADKKK